MVDVFLDGIDLGLVGHIEQGDPHLEIGSTNIALQKCQIRRVNYFYDQ